MLPDPKQIKSAVMIVGIVGAGYLAWKTYKKAGETVEAVEDVITKKLNPVSNENIVYENTPKGIKDGFNSIFAGLDRIGLLPR